jgi:hypothetical protein
MAINLTIHPHHHSCVVGGDGGDGQLAANY